MRLFRTSLLLGVVVLPAPGAARAELIVGLTGLNSLVRFDSSSPGVVSAPVGISGIVGGLGEGVIGIDFRPATPGVLVGLTLQVTGADVGRGRIYEIDPFTGAATLINPMLTNAVGGTEVLLSMGVSGSFTDFGIDFNPVANALRIVNNREQNLRVVGGGAGSTNVDASLNSGNPSVNAIAYSDNVAGATMTTLYGMDSSPNPGTLVTIGGLDGAPSPDTGTLFTVGQLFPADPGSLGNNGLDISGATGIAYAVFQTGINDPDTLFTIDLATGGTTSLGSIGVSPGTLRDISVLNTAVPEPSSLALMGLGAVSLIGYARRRRGRRGAGWAKRPGGEESGAIPE
jgi:hypothetical protein